MARKLPKVAKSANFAEYTRLTATPLNIAEKLSAFTQFKDPITQTLLLP
jgi:hypothetical protein